MIESPARKHTVFRINSLAYLSAHSAKLSGIPATQYAFGKPCALPTVFQADIHLH
jgi:hypothetical protein